MDEPTSQETLDNLIYTVRRFNSDVVAARSQGNGSVPIHFVDDLTEAVAALLTHLDEDVQTV